MTARPYDAEDRFLLSHTAKRQAREARLPLREVDDAALLPEVTYPAGRGGLERRLRGRVAALVDPARGVIVAVYLRDER